MYSYGPPYMVEQKQDDQLKHTYSSYVRIQDVVLKTCRRRWTIGRSGKRGSGISVLAAHDDDDDDDTSLVFVSWFYNCYHFFHLSVYFIIFLYHRPGFVSLFDSITTFVNYLIAKPSFVEGQQWYYLTHSLESFYNYFIF